MGTDPFVWILPAGAALSAGIVLTLLAVPEYSSRLEFVSFGLSVVGIVIGLIIYNRQKKQSDKIEDEGRQIGKIVSRVDEQTNRMADMLNEVRTMNADVRTMIGEARAREDRRRNFHLGHIRVQTTRVRDRTDRAANLIQEFLNNPNPTPDQWRRITRNVETTIGLITDQTMNNVRAHFVAIEGLMMNPGLAARFDGDLWAIAHLLAQIHDINDPIRDFHDRQELIESLRELRDRIAGLENLLTLLE